MVTLCGRQIPSNIQAVTWPVGGIGPDCDCLVLGAAFGGNETPEFMAINPMAEERQQKGICLAAGKIFRRCDPIVVGYSRARLVPGTS